MRSRNRSSNKLHAFRYEQLERRCLLAGDVGVALEGGTLVITGDQLSNQIDVSQEANGDVVFTGRDSTTINGLTEFTFSEAFNRTRFQLNEGADEVILNGFEAGREFRFLGGNGNDRLEANAVTARYYHIQGNAGDDTVALMQSSSRQSAYFHMGDGSDVVAVVSFIAGRNFKVYGDGGNDTFTSDALNVRRKFRLNLGNGNDQALISGETNVGRSSKFRLGSGDDFLGILPDLNGATATFRRHTLVQAGSGNDAVAIGDAIDFERIAKFKGQSGTDAIQIDGPNFERGSIIRRFENQNTENINELIDEVFETLDDVDIDSTLFGNDNATDESSLELDLDDSEIAFEENSAATAIFADLEVQSDSTENIVSAIVQIQDVGDGESLLFEDQNGIAGAFDSGTLTLTGIAPASDYETAIQSVLYQNTSDNPVAGPRTVSISIQSEFPVAPLTANRIINISVVDDPLNLVLPALVSNGTSLLLGEPLEFVLPNADPDNSVVYQLDLEESGIASDASLPLLEPQTGEFSWAPTETGLFALRVLATNDLGQSDQEEFTVLVEPNGVEDSDT